MSFYSRVILIGIVILLAKDVLAQRKNRGSSKDKWAVLLAVIQKLSNEESMLDFEVTKKESVGRLSQTSPTVRFKTIKMGDATYLTSGAVEQFVNDSLIVLVNNDNRQVIATKKETSKVETNAPFFLMKSDSLIKQLRKDWEIKEEITREDSIEYVIVKKKTSKEDMSESVFRIVFMAKTFDFISCVQEETGLDLVDKTKTSYYKEQFGEEAIVEQGEVVALKKTSVMNIRLYQREKVSNDLTPFKMNNVIGKVNAEYKLTDQYAYYKLIFID